MARKFDLSLIPPAPDLSFEADLWDRGVLPVAGIDEAGRGSLAGPVAAAALALPPDPGLIYSLEGVRDSKEMTPAAREYWAERLKLESLAWGVGFASCIEIDALGIVPATRLAAARALECLQVPVRHLLIDFLHLPDCPLPQTALIKGDARCLSIAAASILAKTARDKLVCDLDDLYPGYGFARHKGYATADHYEALLRLGPCEIHRRTFNLTKGWEV